MIKSVLLLFMLLCLAQVAAFAQDNPMRIGTKIGLPNVVGMNFEYVTPWLDGKLAGSLDVSYIPIRLTDPGLNSYSVEHYRFIFSYVELAANYYFFKEGKGLYGSAGVGRVGVNYRYTGVVSDVDAQLTNGTARASLSGILMNFKIGAKLGNSFYFRPEIGYGIVGSMPASTAVTVTFPNGTTGFESDSERIDAPGFLGSVIFNIGFGFAF